MQEFIPIISLNNGIRVIHKEVASPVSHFGIVINAGTRDELPDKNGLAHFIEHTFFKGTSQRNSYQITKRMENVGGELNAYTTKEETYFHASFLSSDYERAIELLGDILFHATFPEKELQKEKDVIIAEINYYRDTPSELIFDEIEEIVFASHPLGRNILGTKKSLKQLQRADVLQFIQKHYTTNQIVLASVGNIRTNTLITFCNKYFGEHPYSECQHIRSPFTTYQPTHIRKHKNISQAHIMLSNLAPSYQHDDNLPFTLLANLLGGQAMSARLNNIIREKMGLAYAVEANYLPYSDTGIFSAYIGCENKHIEKCIELVFKELNKLKQQKLGTLQLHTAKKQYLGQWSINNEAKLNELLSIGRSALSYDKVDDVATSFKKIESITAEQILEISNHYFVRDDFSSLIYTKN